jgi:polysaccharide biosynthesis/export protein
MKIVKFLILIVLISSCVPQRRLNYVQSSKKSPEAYSLKVPEESIIVPGDYLNINVDSPDERNFFGTTATSATGTNEFTLTESAYLVDSVGEVNLPVIGKVKVSGLRLNECSQKLEEIVKSYLTNATVEVRFAFNAFTILGEINSPNRYFFSGKELNIFQAIGMAGDLTFYGKRKDVYIIREKNNQTRKIKVDLRDDEIMSSEYYYIHDKDIILIKSRNYIRWEEIIAPISLLISSISLYILVFQLYNN